MEQQVHVRMFGSLRAERAQSGLPVETRVDVPADGFPARDIAADLGLPLDRIEGVFINHRIQRLSEVVHPGDTIAFVPHGTPGPHRFFLGLYTAGQEEQE